MEEGAEAQGDSGSLDESALEASIRKVLGSLIGTGKVDVADEAEGTGQPAARKTRRTQRDEEDDIAALVRREVQRVKSEDDHHAEHEALRRQRAEAATRPTTPTKPNKVRSFLWGE
jgi:hypothetical protein